MGAHLVTGAFPNRGLRYPKTTEKPAFQTWKEIERQVKHGASEDLWECLFLSRREIKELLTFVECNARHPFIYPMVVMAAHTGARRSEILRASVSDLTSRG